MNISCFEGIFNSMIPSQTEIYTWRLYDWEPIFKGKINHTRRRWTGNLSSPSGPTYFGAFTFHEVGLVKHGPIMTLHPDDTVTFSVYEYETEKGSISPSDFWKFFNTPEPTFLDKMRPIIKQESFTKIMAQPISEWTLSTSELHSFL